MPNPQLLRVPRSYQSLAKGKGGGGLQFGYYQVTQIGFDFINGFVNLIPEGKHKLTNDGGAVTLTFLF